MWQFVVSSSLEKCQELYMSKCKYMSGWTLGSTPIKNCLTNGSGDMRGSVWVARGNPPSVDILNRQRKGLI